MENKQKKEIIKNIQDKETAQIEEATRNGKKKIIVMGLGNLLFTDEGLGVHAIRQIEAGYVFSPEVALIDGGTLGLILLEYLEEASHFLCIDAVKAGQAPGSLVRLEGEELPRYLGVKMSQHQMGFQEVLALASLRGTLPEEMVLIGVQPESLEWGTELSPTVAAALPAVTGAVLELLGRWGVSAMPKG
ncbi:hydrogenase expression/formation protein [Heliomicrobium modesticaldum Ice1]|uniref:Hydrogenase expression/formation protein n=1 Tax=Heliobacterium modesticaldum (strain ATCC 51547 / Ice1) TaxID=498761 RepID=B0TCM8_HELMI|nr:HyaD/HybD family hydrogenase maturation endopeptidase [Heliomicrobium modesticaldum]ABZ84054.1 hydrogenase expression/formation protein [Heliomicrobium modesticaldum Ice1]